MKKIILFIVIILVFIIAILYSTYGKEFLSILDEKKIYKVENIKTTNINTLNEFKFFDRGIISYNNQKIVYMDFDNKILWENETNEFSNKIFVAENYIFRQADHSITVLDKNNQQFVIAEIDGNIINVSRENGKTGIVVKDNGQTLFILNGNNEVVVDNKEFKDIITGLSISDKSEAYSLITLTFENGNPINTLYFNLIEDVELWSALIENEILIKTKVINNNVIAIGTGNIYFYNNNGKLMWKNSIYNKILDYEISVENQRINLLFEKDSSVELISYNFEGKVIEIQEVPSAITKLKIFDNKMLVYNNNTIYLLHSNKADKIFEDSENIYDISMEGSNIYILFKNKIIKGQIK
jgi:hypothetical protein